MSRLKVDNDGGKKIFLMFAYLSVLSLFILAYTYVIAASAKDLSSGEYPMWERSCYR
jgi:hypothetical protein